MTRAPRSSSRATVCRLAGHPACRRAHRLRKDAPCRAPELPLGDTVHAVPTPGPTQSDPHSAPPSGGSCAKGPNRPRDWAAQVEAAFAAAAEAHWPRGTP